MRAPCLRVAIYGRRSSDMQRTTSTEQQRFDCLEEVKKRGWTVVADYADEGESGHDNRRPQVLAMLAAAQRKEFDVLMVWNLSRLARDSTDQGTWIKRLEFNGIRVVTVKGGYDSDSNLKARKITRTIIGLQDEMVSDDMRELIHRGFADQARKGFWCGGKPYGYDLRNVRDPSRMENGEAVRLAA